MALISRYNPQQMIPSFFKRISFKLTLTTLVFIISLAIATTALTVYGFQQTRTEAMQRSAEALEDQGRVSLLDLAINEATVSAAKLEPAVVLAQSAAKGMVETARMGGQVPWDEKDLTLWTGGIYYDADPNRHSEVITTSRFALNDNSRKDLRDSALLEGFFPAVLKQYPSAVAIYYVSPNGFIRYYPVINLVDRLSRISGEQNPALQLGGPAANPAKATVWTPPYLDNAGQGLLVTAIAPVYDGEKFRGVIALDISLASIIQNLNSIQPSPGGYAFLVNTQGAFVAGPPAAEKDLLGAMISKYEASPGASLGIDLTQVPNEDLRQAIEAMRSQATGLQRAELGGRAVLMAYAPLPNTGWGLALVAPVDQVTARASTVATAISLAAGSTIRFILLVMAIVVLLALVGTSSLSRYLLIQPINRLVKGVQAIGGGNLDVSIPVTSEDEIGLLAGSINHMASDLKAQAEEVTSANTALAEREEQYHSVFESVRDGLFINTMDGVMIDFNPAAYRMHGYTEEEFRQIQPVNFIHPDSMPIFLEYIDTVRAGGRFRGRAVDVRKDGSEIHVEIIGTSFTYRGEPHSLAVVRDVTQEVEAYKLLEQRVKDRTRELSTLLHVSQTVTSTLDLNLLLALILDELKEVVAYVTAAVLVLDENQELQLLDQRGNPSERAAVRYRLQPGSPVSTALEQGTPLIIPDTSAETTLAEAWRETAGAAFAEGLPDIRTWMSVPLITKDHPIGMLVLEHTQAYSYSDHHSDLALAFANQAAIAIENARLYEQAKDLASLQERQKLARELHDSVSQALYGIGLGARTARTLLDRDPEKVAEPLEYVLSLAEAGLAEMRALIFELRPESLEMEGLVAALNRHSAAMRARYQIPVETEFCEEPPLPLDTKQALYRVAQEALNNIVKHAHATQVHLRLLHADNAIRLEIIDNGRGFDASGSFPGHLGLKSMQERIEKVEGVFAVVSAPGSGTRVSVEIPL